MFSFTKGLSLLLIAFLSFNITLSHASRRMPDPVDPEVYFSSNKNYSLKIIPSDRKGAGYAHYVYKYKTEHLWAKKLPYTLRSVAISNNGFISGYAYTRETKENPLLLLVVLNDQTEEVYKRVFKRTMPRRLHASLEPFARGVSVHDYNQKVLFRVSPVNEKTLWLSISLNDFKETAIDNIGLDAKKYWSGKILANSINEYSIAQFTFSWKDRSYCLLNAAYQVVWCNTYKGDDHKLSDEDRKLLRNLIATDKLMGFSESSFWVSNIKSKTWEYFTYTNVTAKLSQQKDIDIPTSNINHAIDKDLLPRLKLIKTVTLNKEILNQEQLSRFSVFAFNKHNQIAAISRSGKDYFFELYDKKFQSIIKNKLELDLKKFFSVDLAFWKDDKWLLLAKGLRNETSKIYLLNNTGEVLNKIHADTASAEKLVVNNNSSISFISNGINEKAFLRTINTTGDTLWTYKEYFKKKGGLLSPESIAITPDNEIAVLDHTPKNIIFYSLAGQYLREISLDSHFKDNYGYLTHIQIGSKGDIYIWDFSSKKLLHLNNKGELLEKLSLTQENKKTVSHLTQLRIDSNDGIWINNQSGIRKFDNSGNEELSIQANPSNVLINKVDWFYVDDNETFYFFDESKSLLASLDRKGKSDLVYQLPGLLQYSGRVTSHKGIRKANEIGFLIYGKNKDIIVDRDGNLISAIEKQCGRFTCREKTPQLSNDNYWVVDSWDYIDLVSGINESYLISHQERDVNGNWLTYLNRLYPSSNGWLVIDVGWNKNILIFNNMGKNVLSLPPIGNYISGAQVANDIIYISSYKEKAIRVYNLSGELISYTPIGINESLESDKNILLQANLVTKKLYVQRDKTIYIYELLSNSEMRTNTLFQNILLNRSFSIIQWFKKELLKTKRVDINYKADSLTR